MDIYQELDQLINKASGGNIGFTTLISPEYGYLDDQTALGFKRRPAIVNAFFQAAINVFRLCLDSQLPATVLRFLTADTPVSLGKGFHRNLGDEHFHRPLFYRTDETAPGNIVEIQCPGSMWGECLALQNVLGIKTSANADMGALATGFCSQLTQVFENKEPLVHHLTDNSSAPHGVRYFIESTRSRIRYFGYDKAIKARDCNFVRSHSFYGLSAENHFRDRLQLCRSGQLKFDLPPICLFDQKAPLALPFWSKTREFFSDEIRSILCYCTPVSHDGIELRDGGTLTLDQFSSLPQAQRRFYLKYAGTDVSRNWGGLAVYRLSSDGRETCLRRLQAAADDAREGKYWVIQEARDHKEEIGFVRRDGTKETEVLSVGYRSFNGPFGLLGVVALARSHFKVHGQNDAVMKAFSINES